MEKKRGTFSGGIGFVLAAAGSAVGLGNLWRFPYLAAQYGGGIFILVYIILALTFGFALMTTEIALGRKTGKSPVVAYKMIDKRFGHSFSSVFAFYPSCVAAELNFTRILFSSYFKRITVL